jgi:hypothetical protein
MRSQDENSMWGKNKVPNYFSHLIWSSEELHPGLWICQNCTLIAAHFIRKYKRYQKKNPAGFLH